MDDRTRLPADSESKASPGRSAGNKLRAYFRRGDRAVNRQFNRPLVFLLVSMAGELLILRRYPLLDRNTFYWIALALFLTPTLLMMGSSVLKRVDRDAAVLAALFSWCSAANLALCLGLLVNGALDRAPAAPVQARVLRKAISRGRSSVTYHVIVESWRPGHTEESLMVNRSQFEAIVRDAVISIEIHPGALGLPWYGGILNR